MNDSFAAISFALGIAYLALACLVIFETMRDRYARGISRFGLAYVGMALSCGPHHFIHGTEALQGQDVAWPAVASVLVGLPTAIVFVGLRIEAMAGGRGDRHVHGTPAWLVLCAVGFLIGAGGLAAASLDSAVASQLAPLAIVPNLFVAVTYSLVGVLLLRTQILRRASLGGWSLSGLTLSGIFPSCALMHLTYALTAKSSLSMCPADLFGVPASVYFLWVVHRLYRQAMYDWNSRPIAGAPISAERSAPWAAHRTADGLAAPTTAAA